MRSRRLPGFRFEAQSPVPTEFLPRMDVAVFVGFGSSGPLHHPVRVEDAAEFTAIFGDDAPLAWDAARGEQVYAYLAPAVRAFFRNGGRRAWIIRVAGAAQSNEFPIPCLAQAHFDPVNNVQLQPGFAQARSEGSWSDTIRVSTALLTRSVSLEVFALDQLQFDLVTSSPTNVVAGDLIHVRFKNGGDYELWFAVKAVQTNVVISPPMGDLARLTGDKAIWTRPAWAYQPLIAIGSAFTFTTAGPSAPIGASIPVDLTASPGELDWPKSARQPTVKIDLDLSFAEAPAPGSLLRVDFGVNQFWLTVQDVRVADDAGSPPASIQVIGQGVWLLPNAPSLPSPSIVTAELLTFELRTRRGNADMVTLSDLAFELRQSRCWDALPTDLQLYPELDAVKRVDQIDRTALYQAAADPRFPLAGCAAEHVLYFPIAMPITHDYELEPIPSTARPLNRDGLDDFKAALFLDPDLAAVGRRDLLNEADFIRYLSPAPRALKGLHAALGIEEATLIVVPDAVQRGWIYSDAPDPAAPLPSKPFVRPEWWHHLECAPPPVFKPVAEPEWGNFLNCDILSNLIPAPKLYSDIPDALGTFTLSWIMSPPTGDVAYVLQEAARTDFQDAQDIYSGADDQRTLYGHTPGAYYYRVRATRDGYTSDWSNGVVANIEPVSRWLLLKADQYARDTLLTVHHAILDLCAARGDLFAVLALPEHYREDDALAYATTLTMRGTGFIGIEDSRTLSFGGLYHPWLIGREENQPDEFRRMPPDGALCGIIAKRTLARGAWVAPANERLQGVVALTPPIARERRLDFLEARINLIRQEPRGFLALASDTLTNDTDLRPINVRRLLILLRRLALRLGATYVFEPHSDVFRRSVQRGFEAALEEMFVRGAFAGRTPEAAFQVVTDNVLNPPQSVDQGRFIVELRVAPSQPMAFLTVRLVQMGDRTLVAQER
jgi:hypothetical protein